MTDENTVLMRDLSCHCEHCLTTDYKTCENEEAGEWTEVKLIKSGGGQGQMSLRRAKGQLDQKRRDLARNTVVDQLIAVESCDDPQGFTWWLAVVTHIAYQHVGPTRTTDDGVKLTAGHWYIHQYNVL